VSKSQRTKGANGEREACALLSDHFGLPVKRNLSQTRDGEHDINLRPYRIEVKRRARIANLYDWLNQATLPLAATQPAEGAYRGEVVGCTVPVVMMRADARGWIVCMHFSDWAKIAREELSKLPTK
jgi:hypothetical protein